MILLLACHSPLSFDGVDDYLPVESVSGLDGPALTLEAWVYPEKPTFPKANLIARRDPKGGNDAFTFRIRWDLNGVLELGLANAGREWGMAGRTPVPQQKWSFVAMSHDRNNGMVRLYLDGRLDASQPANIPPGQGEMPLWLGGDPRFGPTGRPFHGSMKNLRIWGTLRSDAQIAEDMEHPPSPDSPGLLWSR